MLLTAVLAVSPAMASPITFANYSISVGGDSWTVTTVGTTTTITDTKAVTFEFTVANSLGAAFTAIPATLVLSTSSSQLGTCSSSGCASGSFTQYGYAGTFSFTDTANSQNLLSGTFATTAGSLSTTGAQLGATIGGSGGTLQASATPSDLTQLVMTSAYLNLTGDTQETATFSLSSASPPFSLQGISGNTAYPAVGTVTASSSGTFSSDSPALTPEPATLSLMGGALIGLAMLRRKKLSSK